MSWVTQNPMEQFENSAWCELENIQSSVGIPVLFDYSLH